MHTAPKTLSLTRDLAARMASFGDVCVGVVVPPVIPVAGAGMKPPAVEEPGPEDEDDGFS